MTASHPSRLFLWLLALGLVAWAPAAVTPSFAEEKPADEDEAGEEEDETGVDLGEANVPFREQVNEAIDKGVAWLKARPDIFEMDRRTDAAHWGLIHGAQAYGNREGHEYQHPAGPTALALYTLLKCGVDPDDEVIEKGFNWLKERHKVTRKWDAVPPNFPLDHQWEHMDKCSSYELSAMILAVTAKYDKYKKTSASKAAKRKNKLKMRNRSDKKWVQTMVELLVERRGQPQPTGLSHEEKRGWRYNVPSQSVGNFRMNGRNAPHANQDLSSTQFAALALYSANRFGIEVDEEVWLDIITFTLDHQEEEGPEHERYDRVYKDGGYSAPIDHARGFCYIKDSPVEHESRVSSSMTACGLTNLLIAYDVLQNERKGRRLLEEHNLHSTIDTAVWDSIAWLDLNWSAFQNRHGIGYHIYYLYALERAMDVMEKSLCGSHVWYEEGAKAILAQAQPHMKEVESDGLTELKETFFWQTGATHDPKDVLDTCFALLFLKRATRGLVPGGVVTGGS